MLPQADVGNLIGEQPTAISKAPSDGETGRQPVDRQSDPGRRKILVRNRDRQRFLAMSWEEVGGLIEEDLLGPKERLRSGWTMEACGNTQGVGTNFIQKDRASF